MTKTLKRVAVAASLLAGFVFSAVGGAIGGIYVYWKAHGSPADLDAAQVAEYAYMLDTDKARPDAQTIDALVHHMNMLTVLAGPAYAQLDERFREPFKKAMLRTAADPRVLAQTDFPGRSASAIRACLVQAGGDATIATCIRQAMDKLLDEACGKEPNCVHRNASAKAS